MGLAAITAALLAENAERCEPALDEAEVEKIAASIARYDPAELADGRAASSSPSPSPSAASG